MLIFVIWLIAVPTAASVEAYPLDSIDRQVSRSNMECPSVELVTYRGKHLVYDKPLRIHPAFEKRLAMFEQIVVEVAMDFYGRPPDRVRTMGSYTCRRIRRFQNLISEHSFGNALDISGFEFLLPVEGGNNSQKLFINVKEHFRSAASQHEKHRKFLETLVIKLIAREVFRVYLGPAWPGHHNHFHFDYAPYELQEVFSGQQADGSS